MAHSLIFLDFRNLILNLSLGEGFPDLSTIYSLNNVKPIKVFICENVWPSPVLCLTLPQADRISHSTTSTNDYNGDFEEDALTDDYGHSSSFQRNKIYSTYPPKGMKKKDQIAFPQRLGPPSVDENLSETSEYQSDCGYNGNPEIMEDISNGPLSSTPTLRRKSAMVRSRCVCVGSTTDHWDETVVNSFYHYYYC